MASVPTRISELTQVTPIGTDQIPIARGFGAGGQTLKITVDSLTKKNTTDVEDLSGRTITVVDSPTIDLTYNSNTRELSADLQMNLDLRSRTILMPSFIEVPPGCIMPFAGKTAPDGWVMCNGDIVPNGTAPVQGKNYDFSRLWAVLGNTYGATPGTLPDLRGYFIRGYGSSADPSVGANADGTESGAFGQKQADAFQGHKHGLYDPQHDHGITDPQHGHTGSTSSGGDHSHTYTKTTGSGDTSLGLVESPTAANAESGVNESSSNTGGTGAHSHTVTVNDNSTGIIVNDNSTNVKVLSPTGDTATAGSGDSNGPGGVTPRVADETRPKNVALLYCIKV
jgi:microcystin-dependent protein